MNKKIKDLKPGDLIAFDGGGFTCVSHVKRDYLIEVAGPGVTYLVTCRDNGATNSFLHGGDETVEVQ